MPDQPPTPGGGDDLARFAAMARIQDQLAELETSLEALAVTVAELQAQPPAGERAIWWPTLDRAAAVTAWQQLGDWVAGVLLARAGRHERNRVLRACWRQHPDVVDELTALRVVWLDTYQNPATAATSAAEYLGRYLPEAMARIEAAFAADGCTAGIHSVHKEPDHRPGRQWDTTELTDFLSTDQAGRPEPQQ